MATAKFHWGKPIWVTSRGAELPITNMALPGVAVAALGLKTSATPQQAAQQQSAA